MRDGLVPSGGTKAAALRLNFLEQHQDPSRIRQISSGFAVTRRFALRRFYQLVEKRSLRNTKPATKGGSAAVLVKSISQIHST